MLEMPKLWKTLKSLNHVICIHLNLKKQKQFMLSICTKYHGACMAVERKETRSVGIGVECDSLSRGLVLAMPWGGVGASRANVLRTTVAGGFAGFSASKKLDSHNLATWVSLAAWGDHDAAQCNRVGEAGTHAFAMGWGQCDAGERMDQDGIIYNTSLWS